MDRLNLGCGGKRRSGHINLDIDSACGPDLVGDAFMLPFPDGKFGEVFADNVLEHLDERAIAEIGRVLSHGGRLRAIVPHCFGRAAYNDYTHRRFFNVNTFDSPPFSGFRLESLVIHYSFWGGRVSFTLPKALVAAHERLLPGILPPTHMEAELVSL